MRRCGSVLVGVIGLAVSAVVAAPAAAANALDTAPPTLVDVEVSPDAVSVSGLDLAPVTVRVHLTDESGVNGDRSVYAWLERVSGGPKLSELVLLRITSGTARDGVWAGTARVPSTWDGSWSVSMVSAVDTAGNASEVDPRASTIVARLAVTGTHRPALTMRFRPDPVVGAEPVTVEGRVHYADTGVGIPEVDLFIGLDNECVEYTPRANARTNDRGEYSYTFANGEANFALHCVGILRPSSGADVPAYIVSRAECPRVKPTVTATANRTSVRAGGRVTVTARVAPVYGTPQLQRRDGGAWRTVATATFTGPPGKVKVTLVDNPPRAGTYEYRVRVRNEVEDALSGVSETIAVEVTGDDVLPVTGPSVRLVALIGLALALAGGALLLLVGRSRVGAGVRG
jgi:hypothetical protein